MNICDLKHFEAGKACHVAMLFSVRRRKEEVEVPLADENEGGDLAAFEGGDGGGGGEGPPLMLVWMLRQCSEC